MLQDDNNDECSLLIKRTAAAAVCRMQAGTGRAVSGASRPVARPAALPSSTLFYLCGGGGGSSGGDCMDRC